MKKHERRIQQIQQFIPLLIEYGARNEDNPDSGFQSLDSRHNTKYEKKFTRFLFVLLIYFQIEYNKQRGSMVSGFPLIF